MLDLRNLTSAPAELTSALTSALVDPSQRETIRDFLVGFRRIQFTREEREKLSDHLTPAKLQELVELAADDPEIVKIITVRVQNGYSALSPHEEEQVDKRLRDFLDRLGLGSLITSVTAGVLIALGTAITLILALVAAILGKVAIAAAVIIFVVGLVLVVVTLAAGAVIAAISYIASLGLEEELAVGTKMLGGRGGSAFEMPHDTTKITSIDVFVGPQGESEVVRGLRVHYTSQDGEGEPFLCGTTEGVGDPKPNVFKEDEELVQVQVAYGYWIDSVQFVARNRNTGSLRFLDRHGGSGGGSGSLELPNGAPIRGFFGRAGRSIDALGVCDSSHHGVMLGGAGGKPFFDIRLLEGNPLIQISARTGDVVDALLATWKSEGAPRVGSWHGNFDGGRRVDFDLDEGDSIAQIDVYKAHHKGYEVIQSLKIHTRNGKSAEFGKVPVGPDESPVEPSGKLVCPPDRTIVGFFGRAGLYLDALGICVR